MSLSAATDGWLSSGTGAASGPVITAATPTVGVTIEAADELVITVESEEDGVDVDTIDSIEIRLIGSGIFVEIYDGAAFAAPYLGSSVDITDGVATITIAYDGGWIAGVAEVRVTATDDGATQNIDAIGSWFFDVAAAEAEESPAPIAVEITVEATLEPIDHVAAALDRLPVQCRRPPA